MAKIDTSKIAGYSAMSAEEKLAALEAFDISDNASEIDNYKKMLNKASSEAAEWKRKHNALLSDEEKAKAEAEEERQRKDNEFAEMQKRINDLEKEKMIATYNASFVSMGYNAELATKTANALADGKMNEVFAYMKQHGEDKEKELRAEILKSTPTPSTAGKVDNPLTADEIMAIKDPVERQQKIAENINLFS